MIQAFNTWLEDFQLYTQIHQHIHPRAAFTDRKLITWLETQWAALKMVDQFRGGEHVEWDRLVEDRGINNKSLYKYARMTECHVDGTGRGGLPEDYGISRGY